MDHPIISRRMFLNGTAAMALGTGVTCPAWAQESYPNKPVHLVLPLGPGSANDTVGRLLAISLSKRLKQPVVVDNRAGGGGTIGTAVVAKAAPDGYTIGFGTLSTLVANAALYQKLPFDFERDLLTVAFVTRAPLLLLASTKIPATNLRDLLRYAKANPGKLSYASAGIGSINHVITESLLARAGVQMLHVPYKSNAPALLALAGGEVDLLFDTAISVAAMTAKKLVKVLAAGGTRRMTSFSDVPTFAEEGFADFDASTWTAVIAPRGTPAQILEVLRSEINAALAEPEVRAGIEKTGSEVFQLPTLDAAEALVAAERKHWIPLIRSLKIELN